MPEMNDLQATPSTGVLLPKIVKFTLPEFTTKNPKTWFSAVEHIFTANGIESEADKFSNLLQHLDSQQLTHICDIIANSADQKKYSSAKERLISVHGQSRTQEISTLLNDTQVENGLKPSIIFSKLKNLAGENFDKELLQNIWLKKLPHRTREILAVKNDTLENLCKFADRLFETYEKEHRQVASVATASTQPTEATPSSSQFEVILALLQSQQAQINSIQQTQTSLLQQDRRPRRRSPTPHRFKARSVSKGRSKAPDMINGMCWYHHTFKDQAYKCAPGCNFQKNA